MKVRLAKQIQQIEQCLTMFKSTKVKCERIMTQLNLQKTLLNPFEGITKLFSIDLRILDMDHLYQRKKKLMNAIDDISKLENKLNLMMIRNNQIQYQNQQQEQQLNQTSINQIKHQQSFVEKIPEVEFQQYAHKRRLPKCQVELTSRCAQLLDVWTKNKGQPNQNVDDKFDRLSKIIGILKKNVKEIYNQQKLRTNTISLYDYQEYNQIKDSLEKTKQENLLLRSEKNILISENIELKQTSIKKSQTVEVEIQTTPIQKQSTSEQTLVDSDHFKIIKFYKSQFSIDGSSILQKPEGQLEQSIIKTTSMTDSVIQYILQKPQSVDSEESQHQINTDWASNGILTFSKRGNNQQKSPFINTQELNHVETKLKEMKQNRRRIIEDDNIWAEMENIKL